jgi:hypothetical protein
MTGDRIAPEAQIGSDAGRNAGEAQVVGYPDVSAPPSQ